MPERKYAKPNGKGHQGPKPLKIDPDQIRHLASIGCTADEIAVLLSPPGKPKLLEPNYLEKKFYAVLKQGKAELHRSLKHELVSRALAGNTAALIFALKAYCRLSDSNSDTSDSRSITIHFDYGQAKAIEERAVPIRDAVKNMLQNYRKDLDNPNQAGPDPDLDSQPPQSQPLMIEDNP